MRITRRKFVQAMAALGAGLALGQAPLLTGQSAQAATGGSSPERGGPGAPDHPAILYDLTRCAGCHMCEIACQLNKNLPPERTLLSFRAGGVGEAEDAARTAWAVRRHQCLHCLNPACVSACPVGAMRKTAEGPVIYREERCLGCRYCMTACPFGVPTFDWDSGLLDQALIHKCNVCHERQVQGKRPACIEACPTQAVTFGKRAALLAEARRRIAANPEHYVTQIYGEQEAGGTSFLLISGVPFAKLGLPNPGTHALPELSEKVMSGVLPFAVGWATVLSLVTYGTHRTGTPAQKWTSGEEESQ